MPVVNPNQLRQAIHGQRPQVLKIWLFSIIHDSGLEALDRSNVFRRKYLKSLKP